MGQCRRIKNSKCLPFVDIGDVIIGSLTLVTERSVAGMSSHMDTHEPFLVS